MTRIVVNPELCKREGLCQTVCVQGVFVQEEKSAVPTVTREEACFDCGHCVAVCPGDAISHSSFPEDSGGDIKPELEAGYDQVLQLLRGRRSKRAFTDEPVSREDMEKIIEAARFAPSGHNCQGTRYAAVLSPGAIAEIGSLTASALRKLVKPFASPIGRLVMRAMIGARKVAAVTDFAPELVHLASLYDDGTDLLLYGAPALLLFHADEVDISPGTDANLALQNASLAVEALGLGCFYTGFVVAACDRDDSIARFLELPEHHKIYAGLAIGHPRVKFRRWPERRPARVTWK